MPSNFDTLAAKASARPWDHLVEEQSPDSRFATVAANFIERAIEVAKANPFCPNEPDYPPCAAHCLAQQFLADLEEACRDE